MRFAEPDLLWLILLLPALALVRWLSGRRQRRALDRFAGGAQYVNRFVQQVSAHRRALKLLLLYLASAAVIVAAARPQWGTRLEPVTRRGIDVVVVVDNSLSMAAQDIAPNRLAYARHAIDSLLKQLPGDRVALLSFAGQASLVCPLTVDHGAVRLFLETIEPESIQVPGTALAEALALAAEAFGEQREPGDARNRAIVLFTDGEDHEGGLEEAVADLQRAGIAIHAVGCGTTRGAPIPVKADTGARSGYKKDREDRVVTTRLDELALEQLALQTGGSYYRGTATEVEVEEIAHSLHGLDAQEFGELLRARYEERFQLPLGIALLALIAETVLGDRRGRRADARRRAEGG